MKKNLIFVIPTLRMGGAEKSLVSLLKLLDSSKYNVDLFLFEAGGILQKEVPNWINIISADPITRGMTLEIRIYLGDLFKEGAIFAALTRLWITVRSKITQKPQFNWAKICKYIPTIEKQYDIGIGYLEGTTDFFVIDKVHATKKIGWIHTDYSGKTLPAEEIEFYKRFDKLVTISETCKTALQNIIPDIQNKLMVFENPVLWDDIRKKAKEESIIKWNTSAKCHIVTVGRLEHVKGIDIAAQAAKILKGDNISFCWHVYGQGILFNEIQNYIMESELQDCFVLEGVAENPYPYMNKADIIVQPSRWEGKSIVLDEAKILRKAIVVTNYPSVIDQVQDGITAIITECAPEAIAVGIEELINNPELKEKLERNLSGLKNNDEQTLERFYKLLK